MRSSNNDHQVSWEAAYALIKRQKSGMFKTSPEHAAVMITEAVVEDPGSYPDCGHTSAIFSEAAKALQNPSIAFSTQPIQAIAIHSIRLIRAMTIATAIDVLFHPIHSHLDDWRFASHRFGMPQSIRTKARNHLT